MYKLRSYQQNASDAAINHFIKGDGNGLMVLPTGAGKSLVIADIANRLNDKVLVFQPSKELVEQNFEKYSSYSNDGAIFSASIGKKDIGRVTFATIGTAINNIDYFRNFKYVIHDECHIGTNPKGSQYEKFYSEIKPKIIGLTATAVRFSIDGYGGAMLKFLTRMKVRMFDELIYYTQIKKLLDEGFLNSVQYYPIKVVDRNKLVINSTGSDYTDSSVKSHYADIHFEEELANIVRRLMVAGRKSILVFTRFTDEAEYACKILGVGAVVTGNTEKKERENIINGFKNFSIPVVFNVGVLATGFDFPSLSTAVLARSTRSLAIYYQIVGRIMRVLLKNGVNIKEPSWFVDISDSYSLFGKVEDITIKNTGGKKWAYFSGDKQISNVYFK